MVSHKSKSSSDVGECTVVLHLYQSSKKLKNARLVQIILTWMEHHV